VQTERGGGGRGTGDGCTEWNGWGVWIYIIRGRRGVCAQNEGGCCVQVVGGGGGGTLEGVSEEGCTRKWRWTPTK
jgi:hypothetical protein